MISILIILCIKFELYFVNGRFMSDKSCFLDGIDSADYLMHLKKNLLALVNYFFDNYFFETCQRN